MSRSPYGGFKIQIMSKGAQSEPAKRLAEPIVKHGWVNLLTVLLFVATITAILPFFEPKTQSLEAVSVQSSFLVNPNAENRLPLYFQENTLLSVSETAQPGSLAKVGVIITGYSSTVWQTDDTPFITASGSHVRQGIVAANFLPFGTKIRIPEIYGSEIFVVEDRMHSRNNQNVDIWFSTCEEATNFGAIQTYIEIL